MIRMPVKGFHIACFAVVACTAAITQASWPDERQNGAGTPNEDATPTRTEFVTPSAIIELPATYEGDLPAADGPEIRYHLDLFEDHVYWLRLTDLGRGAGATIDDMGTWHISADGTMLTLRGEHEEPVQFTVKTDSTLRKLDLEGKEIAGRQNYDLNRAAQFSPIEPRVKMRGMYSYMADAGLFQECSTRRKFPVAQEGDNAALESSYSKTRGVSGEGLLVQLEGKIAKRRRIDRPGLQDTLVVERFITIWPGETCGAQFSTATLTNTYWKLVRLNEHPVTVFTDRREPHMILRLGEPRQISGFTGCNRLMGGYELEEQTLRFRTLATTKMACPTGMDQEQTFLQSLEAARRWKIRGEHLELFDSDGHLLVRFEARYME